MTAKSVSPWLDREFVFQRLLDAPRSVVFQAWTDPKQVAAWWGPTGFTNPVCELDVRPGGAIRIDMQSPCGTVYPMIGEYQEISFPERLVFTSAAINELGQPMFVVLNTVEFAEQAGKTSLTVTARVVEVSDGAENHLPGMDQGWNMTLDRLQQHLSLKS
jgi:uncharacterized protein YndB with AHSA1/START domain